MDMQAIANASLLVAVQLALKIAGAFALWLIGRRLIQFVVSLLHRALARQLFDATLSQYLETATSVLLTIALIISILGFFGVQTTTFAALIAAGGVAIGVAWSGLLANFAAGTFLVVLRPFKVGDDVMAGGVTGTVQEIGLFGTVINSADGVRTIVGNNKIFSDTIHNYSANPYRRVDLVTTINNAVDHDRAIRLLRERLQFVPHVLAAPVPVVDVLQFTPAGPVLCVRPYCHPKDYGQVYFDTNRMIREAFAEAGFPAPVPEFAVQTHQAGAAAAGVAGPSVS
jgi:small conductance mechanosensitive channel